MRDILRAMQIRTATEDDVPALAMLITQLGYPTSEPQMHRRLEGIRGDRSFVTFIAQTDRDEVIGMAGVKLDPSYEYDGLQARIVALVVAESHRGAGVGGALVEHVEQFARENGAVKVVVNTASHRTRTHEFYRWLGYEMTGLRFVKSVEGP